MRYFMAVADRLHFGRAAESLHISQPPLSRAIRTLEQRLGVALFARSRRRVELTAEGARFLEEARRITAQLERSVLELRGIALGEQGRLRIGFVSLADYGVLPGLLKGFKTVRPGVRLSLREMLSPDQATALGAGELDFGLLLPRWTARRISSAWWCSGSVSSRRFRPGTAWPGSRAASRSASSPASPS
jgi:DNA-binding transcriptional LysR family regulator